MTGVILSVICQARRGEEKQAMLAVWTRQGVATTYTVDNRDALRQAMGVHARTAGRSYYSAPTELETVREETARRRSARPGRAAPTARR